MGEGVCGCIILSAVQEGLLANTLTLLGDTDRISFEQVLEEHNE